MNTLKKYWKQYLMGFIAIGHGWIGHDKLVDGEPWSAAISMAFACVIMFFAITTCPWEDDE